MSIGKRITEVIERLSQNDPESAFLSVCSAVEGTAGNEYPSVGATSQRFKDFLHENRDLIGVFGFLGIMANQIQVPAHHPRLRPDANGTCPIEDVLYTVVRCGLDHEATIESYVEFKPGTLLGCENGKYQLCPNLPLGLAVAVMANPTNVSERLVRPVPIPTIRGVSVDDRIWGQRDKLREHLFAGGPW
jgi:hypothetical protein